MRFYRVSPKPRYEIGLVEEFGANYTAPKYIVNVLNAIEKLYGGKNAGD